MSNQPLIDPKLKTLIALGASVASGCQPCTEFHVRASRDNGACPRGIGLAVEAALAARHAATRGIDRWSERCQGTRPELDPEFRANKELLTELVAVASAICVQSVPDLVLHLAEASRLGATPELIRVTIAIARSVHNAAMEQIEAVLATANGGLDEETQPASACGPAQPCNCR